jgi:UDP-glucose 4-epimerase
MITQQLTDGTCIRDYIHIVDLAKARYCFATTSKQKNADEIETFNLGTGTGSSVLR